MFSVIEIAITLIGQAQPMMLSFVECTNLKAEVYMKYVLPLLAITISVIYIRHCIKSADRPPEETRLMVYHDNETGEDWELGPEDLIPVETYQAFVAARQA